MMPTVTTTQARSRLHRLIDETASSHQPVLITGTQGNAVLVSEEDWQAVQETLYLLSIPGMRESIRLTAVTQWLLVSKQRASSLRMLASSSMMRMFIGVGCPALRLYASRTSSTDAADDFKGSGEC